MVKKLVLSFLSGILIFLSFPKWNYWFLAWVALVPLLLAIHGLSVKKSFFLGWLTGTTAFCGILCWILPTFQAAGVSTGIGILSLFLLAGYIGLYYGIFASISQKSIENLHPAFVALFIPCLWVLLEYLRNHLFTGFPWGLLGYSQWKALPVIQISEFTGIYGVSFLIVLVNLSISKSIQGFHPSTKVHSFSLAGIAGLLVLLNLFFGFYKTAQLPNDPMTQSLSIAILQGNINQYKKWDTIFVHEILATYSMLSLKATQSLNRSVSQSPNFLIVWPETALPGWLPNQKWLYQWTEQTVKKTETFNLIGAVTDENGKNYNSAFLFEPSGKIVGRYDKIHLVPFGEFVPIQSFLGKWIGVLNELGGFQANEKLQLLEIPKAKLGVSICYEAIFPELIRKQAKEGAEILVNITNDGWYLDTAAPEQHFSMNVFRAVENRRFLVRAANTGISGIILPDGSILQKTKLNTTAILTEPISPKQEKTFYTKFGDYFAWLSGGISMIGILFLLKKRWE